MQKIFFLSLVVLFAGSNVMAQRSAIFKTAEGIAIKGYDPVAFFTENKAVKGVDSIQWIWKEAVWLFSSSSNRDIFQKNPEKYEPQFGGYCAYGVAGNHKSPTETDTWTIIDGRLYFNYNQAVKKLWLKDTAVFIPKANTIWPQLRNQ